VVHAGIPVIHTALPKAPGPLAVIEQSAALVRGALACRPDLVHLFKPKGYGGLAALWLRLIHPSLPLVVDSDDWEGPGGWNDLLAYPSAARRLFAWQEVDLPRRASAVTVASRTLEWLVWSMGVAPQRVFWLPNGVSRVASAVQPSGRAAAVPQMLLYTRFWEFDLHELLAALVAIHQACPSARLIVVGQGERGEERRLLALAQRAGIAGMIDARGWLPPEQIPAVLAEADLALAPISNTLINRTRGMAKLLELMQAGLPIVAADVGIARDYLGEAGILVPPADPAALAQAALRLIGDAALREVCAHQALQACVRFDWDRLAQTAEAAYVYASRQ
jgi:glycosyltransferase involved in cell wall biosynthesis